MSALSVPPAVVLVRPQEEGNIGAVARAMANMGLDELVLAAPECEPGRVARALAVGAGKILDARRTTATFAEAVAPYQRLVGTTSTRGRSVPVTAIPPRELPARLADDPPGARAALVFGGERSGLSTDELARCSPLVRIPCAARQPTLNLSQAVLILAYELHLTRAAPAAKASPEPPLAAAGEIEGLFAQLEPLLRRIGFARDDTFASVLRDLRRLAARAALTSHEVIVLRGICRRGRHALQ